MPINSFVWECFINLLESFLFYVFIETNLRTKDTSSRKKRYLQFLYLFAQYILLCSFNLWRTPSLFTIIAIGASEVIYTVLFYNKSIAYKFVWGLMFSVLCLVSEFITFFIPQTLSTISSPEILFGGVFRIPFTLLYIALIAIFVFISRFIFSKSIILSIRHKIIYSCISLIGIIIAHYMMLVTIRIEVEFHSNRIASNMIIVNLCFIILFIALLTYIYMLGRASDINAQLMEQQKTLELEDLEYRNLIKSTEALREMKHDIEIHLDVIQSLAIDSRTEDLISYIESYHATIKNTHFLLSTGNAAIDCIVSTKIDLAQKSGILTDYSILIPNNFSIDPLALSSLLGNLWNNSLEACQRLQNSKPDFQPHIHFYIKPFKDMITIHIENDFDGFIKKDNDGYYLSTKNDPDHGIGLKRVLTIINNANGIISINSNDNIFSVHIMIPISEGSERNENNNP